MSDAEPGIASFSRDFFSLEGKTAIVTGGNTGLGQAFTVALATMGADVLAAGLSPEDGVTAELVEQVGSRYAFLEADITAPGVPRSVIECGRETFGPLDILVNCAGRVINEPDVLRFTRQHWDPLVALNLTAAFEMSREAAQVMVPRRSGKIINVCSVFSFLGGRWSPAYTATKHGIAGLTKAYCDELAPFGIQVNGLAPGYYTTPVTADTRADAEANQRVLDHIPAGRWGHRQDLMGATAFLASRASDYVNGHVLTVDGGYLVR